MTELTEGEEIRVVEIAAQPDGANPRSGFGSDSSIENGEMHAFSIDFYLLVIWLDFPGILIEN